MYDPLFTLILLNIIYLMIFIPFLIAFVIFNSTGKKLLAKKLIAYPFIILSLLGMVLNLISLAELAVPFVILYIFLLWMGIYMFRWDPKEKISLNN